MSKPRHLSLLAKWAIRQSLGTVRGNDMITVIEAILSLGDSIPAHAQTETSGKTSVQISYQQWVDNDDTRV